MPSWQCVGGSTHTHCHTVVMKQSSSARHSRQCTWPFTKPDQAVTHSAHIAVHHYAVPKKWRQPALQPNPHARQVQPDVKAKHKVRVTYSCQSRCQGEVLHQWHEGLQDSEGALVQHLLQRHNLLPYTKHLSWAHAYNLRQPVAGGQQTQNTSQVGQGVPV